MSNVRPVLLRDFDKAFSFESFGVKIRIESIDADLLEKASSVVQKALAGNFSLIENDPQLEFSFGLTRSTGGALVLYRDGQFLMQNDLEVPLLRYFNAMIRIRVAEFAVGKVFLHSGAVAVNGQALLIPGNSYSGKSTLVADLIKNGAEYYSDEYAVLDEEGLNYPFPRDLSLRDINGGRTKENDLSPDALGASVGKAAIPVRLILITKYEEGALWQPEMLSLGQGIFELIPFTISLKNNAEFSLRVLKNSLSRAIIAKSPRGDSTKFAETILSFFDKVIT
ncbi:MAG TPA: hypothetical protein DEA22_05455 [Blastocatellia bacterium]|nr:hypothetical protein [Blastocatellia bacterium]